MNLLQQMSQLVQRIATLVGAEADQALDDMDALWFAMNDEQQEEALEIIQARDAIREGA